MPDKELHYEDPLIPVLYAIDQFENQADLAYALGVSRPIITQLIKGNADYMPVKHAYRLLQIKPKAFKKFCPSTIKILKGSK